MWDDKVQVDSKPVRGTQNQTNEKRSTPNEPSIGTLSEKLVGDSLRKFNTEYGRIDRALQEYERTGNFKNLEKVVRFASSGSTILLSSHFSEDTQKKIHRFKEQGNEQGARDLIFVGGKHLLTYGTTRQRDGLRRTIQEVCDKDTNLQEAIKKDAELTTFHQALARYTVESNQLAEKYSPILLAQQKGQLRQDIRDEVRSFQGPSPYSPQSSQPKNLVLLASQGGSERKRILPHQLTQNKSVNGVDDLATAEKIEDLSEKVQQLSQDLALLRASPNKTQNLTIAIHQTEYQIKELNDKIERAGGRPVTA